MWSIRKLELVYSREEEWTSRQGVLPEGHLINIKGPVHQKIK